MKNRRRTIDLNRLTAATQVRIKVDATFLRLLLAALPAATDEWSDIELAVGDGGNSIKISLEENVPETR